MPSVILLGRYRVPVGKGGMSQQTIALLKETVATQAQLDRVKMAMIDKETDVAMVSEEVTMAAAGVTFYEQDIQSLHDKRNKIMASNTTSKAFKRVALASIATELATLRKKLQAQEERLARLRALQASHRRKMDALLDLRSVLRDNLDSKAKAVYEAAVQDMTQEKPADSSSNNDNSACNEDNSAVAQDTQESESPTSPAAIESSKAPATPVPEATLTPLTTASETKNPMNSQKIIAAIKAIKGKMADVEAEIGKIERKHAPLAAEVAKANKAAKKAKSKAFKNARSARKVTKALAALQAAEAKLAPVQQQLSSAQATLAQLAADKEQLGQQLAQALRAMVASRQAAEAPVTGTVGATEVNLAEPAAPNNNQAQSEQGGQATTGATPSPASPLTHKEEGDKASSTPASPAAAPASPTTFIEAGSNDSPSAATDSPTATPDSPVGATTPAEAGAAEAVTPVAAAPVQPKEVNTKEIVCAIKSINGMMVNLSACIKKVEAARAPLTAQVAQATQQLQKEQAALNRVRQTRGQSKAKQAAAAARLSGNVTRAQKALQLAQAQLAPWEGKLAAAKATLEDLAAEKARLGATLAEALKALVAGRQGGAVPCAATKIETSSKVCDIDEAVEGPSELIAVYNPEGSCCLSDSDDGSSLYSGCLSTERSAEIAGSDSVLSGCSSFRSEDSSSSDVSCTDAADAAAQAVAIVSTTTDGSTGAGSPIAITAAPVSRSRLRAEAPEFVPQSAQTRRSSLRADAPVFVPLARKA